MILPTLHDRLQCREKPSGMAVMSQAWSRILFLHWKVDPDILRRRLPQGLHLDLHNGEAWLGIVPFFMGRIRPAFLPPVPGLSWFLELNVRTYVHDDRGLPGVWFHSLDCNQPLAVELARHAFHLPYQHAKMDCETFGQRTAYSCLRHGEATAARYLYGPDGRSAPAAPESLEFFLTERYVLFSADKNGSLFVGRVHHQPYQLTAAKCDEWSPLPATWEGFPAITTRPDSALYTQGVDVGVYPLKRLTLRES